MCIGIRHTTEPHSPSILQSQTQCQTKTTTSFGCQPTTLQRKHGPPDAQHKKRSPSCAKIFLSSKHDQRPTPSPPPTDSCSRLWISCTKHGQGCNLCNQGCNLRHPGVQPLHPNPIQPKKNLLAHLTAKRSNNGGPCTQKRSTNNKP